MSVPHHLAGGGRHGLQRFDGRFGLALLHHAQNGIEQHHHQDDGGFGEIFPRHKIGDARHHRCRQQNQQHGVFQLLDEPLCQRRLGGPPQPVGAILPQTFLGLWGAQTLCRGAQLLQNLGSGLRVNLLHGGCLLSDG